MIKKSKEILIRKPSKPPVIRDEMTGIAEVKIQYNNELTTTHQAKDSCLNLVHFQFLNSALLKFS